MLKTEEKTLENTAKEKHLCTFLGFNKCFEDYMALTMSYTAAYELAEKAHEAQYGFRKYAGYDCLRKARQRKMSQKMTVKKPNCKSNALANKNKLEGRMELINLMIEQDIPKTKICVLLEVTPGALNHFMTYKKVS